MEYILDTHACLWAFADYKKISANAKSILEQDGVKIFVSQISVFEIAIKLNIEKLLDFKIELEEFIQLIKSTGVEILPVKEEHLIAYTKFVFHNTHRDPFDRYLIATAFAEQKAIITKDEKFNFYADKIKLVW